MANTPRPIAVLDIDGVLADVRHRLHHVEGRRKDWSAFFRAAPRDPLLAEGAALARELAATHDIVYLTGRPESCRADTLGWLASHDLPPGQLHMRRPDDRRPARVVKPTLLRTLGRDRVAVVVDDDPAVCAALTAQGWPVRQAEWMTRPEVLDTAQERLGRT